MASDAREEEEVNFFGLDAEEEGIGGNRTSSVKVYDVNGEKVPVAGAEHYQRRGEALHALNLDEYMGALEIRPLSKASAKAKEKGETYHIPDNAYEFDEAHPLRETHLQYERGRGKMATLMFSGAPPPKPPPQVEEGRRNAAWKRMASAYAAYFITLFVPWPAEGDGSEGWDLSYEFWELYKETLRDIVNRAPISELAPCTDDAATARLKLRRDLAAARLFRIENVERALRVRELPRRLNAAWRARNCTIWAVEGRPADEEPATRVGDAKVAQIMQQVRDRSELLAEDVAIKRQAAAAKAADWTKGLVERLQRVQAAAINGLQREAATRTARANGASPAVTFIPRDGAAALKGTIDAFKKARPSVNVQATPSNDVHMEEESPSRSAPWSEAVGDGDFSEPSCLADIEPHAYEEEVAAWQVKKAAAKARGEAPPDGPLNLEQRAFLRPVLTALHCLAKERQRHRGMHNGSALAYQATLRKRHVLQHMLIGAAGVGKSVTIHALKRLMKELKLGRLVGSAFTGVAAAPYGCPTLCTLLGISQKQVGSEHEAKLSATALAEMRERLRAYAGCELDEIRCFVIDEISFLRDTMVGQVMRALSRTLLPCCPLPEPISRELQRAAGEASARAPSRLRRDVRWHHDHLRVFAQTFKLAVFAFDGC